MPAVENGGDVDVNDIAISEGTVAGDAVADDFVDGGTDAGRKAVIVQGRRDGAVVEGVGVDEGVDFFGGDTDGESFAGLDKGTCGELTGTSHGDEVRFAFDDDACHAENPVGGQGRYVGNMRLRGSVVWVRRGFNLCVPMCWRCRWQWDRARAAGHGAAG